MKYDNMDDYFINEIDTMTESQAAAILHKKLEKRVRESLRPCGANGIIINNFKEIAALFKAISALDFLAEFNNKFPDPEPEQITEAPGNEQ